MTKAAFDRIAAGLGDAIDYVEGSAALGDYRVHSPQDIDVRSLRRRLDLTRTEFAHRYGFSPARVRDWEHGRSRPDGAVRAYLLVIDREPSAVDRALGVTSARAI